VDDQVDDQVDEVETLGMEFQNDWCMEHFDALIV
jgi:hypothetical protein